MAGAEAPAKGDLGVRTASAVAMVAVAGLALWIGGWGWIAFVGMVAVGVFFEWRSLTRMMTSSPARRGLWNFAAIVYIGWAAFTLVMVRMSDDGIGFTLAITLGVIATDVGAYFAGRTFGGPKIAPSISPSKTWAGLIGGMVGASAVLLAAFFLKFRAETDALSAYVRQHGAPDDWLGPPSVWQWQLAVLLGCGLAVTAQAGDFFESWMKRRAGVKDSGRLLPGHGGLFDRVDGLLAVLFVIGVLSLRTMANLLS